MECHLRFRWALLIAFGFWLFTAVCWAAGLTEPGKVTFPLTFVIPVMVCILMSPMAISHIARRFWFVPAYGVWIAIAPLLLNVANISLFGIGERCIRVSVVSGIGGCIALHVVWLWELRRMRKRSSEVPSDVATEHAAPGTCGRIVPTAV